MIARAHAGHAGHAGHACAPVPALVLALVLALADVLAAAPVGAHAVPWVACRRLRLVLPTGYALEQIPEDASSCALLASPASWAARDGGQLSGTALRHSHHTPQESTPRPLEESRSQWQIGGVHQSGALAARPEEAAQADRMVQVVPWDHQKGRKIPVVACPWGTEAACWGALEVRQEGQDQEEKTCAEAGSQACQMAEEAHSRCPEDEAVGAAGLHSSLQDEYGLEVAAQGQQAVGLRKQPGPRTVLVGSQLG